MKLLLNNEFGWAECLPMVIDGSTGVNVGVLWANFGYDQGTAAIFLVLNLHCGRLNHRLFTTQPNHLWVRISCKDKWQGWGKGQMSKLLKQSKVATDCFYVACVCRNTRILSDLNVDQWMPSSERICFKIIDLLSSFKSSKSVLKYSLVTSFWLQLNSEVILCC